MTIDVRKSAIFAFQLVKPILQTITHLIQYTVLEIQFWSVKCTTVTVRYVKISIPKTSIYIPSHQTMQERPYKRLQWLDYHENKPLQNAFKRI